MPWSRSSMPSRRSDVMRPPRSGRISMTHRFELSIIAATMLAAVALGACSPASAHRVASSPPPVAAVEPDTSPSPAPAPSHVFVVVMENRSYEQALAGGYTAQLAAKYGVATNYHGVSHPSLPNYLAMTSGSTWGVTDDGYHSLPASGLGQQLGVVAEVHCISRRSSIVDVVTSSSRSSSTVTPRPGPVGTPSRPPCRTKGSVTMSRW